MAADRVGYDPELRGGTTDRTSDQADPTSIKVAGEKHSSYCYDKKIIFRLEWNLLLSASLLGRMKVRFRVVARRRADERAWRGGV
jgi:hypothetical protein